MTTTYLYRYTLHNSSLGISSSGVLDLKHKIDTLELHDRLVDELTTATSSPDDYKVTYLALFEVNKPSLWQRLFG